MPHSEQLTPEDVKRIEAEIEYRRMTLRPQNLKALKEARAMGDLSENFEYYAAKRDNNINNSRIRYLEKMLRFANVIEDNSTEETVGINNTVTVCFDGEEDDEETYRIVTSIRSDSRRGLISSESPLGKALLGKKAGDRAEVKTDDGNSYFVTIKELRKTGEAPDDHIHSY